MDDFCFVIQPYDHGKFDRRYREIIRPAVESCGLCPYRVDEDFQVNVPIVAIQDKISAASLILAEITTDSPNVWFELGYALAKEKPLILICSDERTTKIPFDIRHRNIFRYQTGSPSDFERFRRELESRIRAKLPVRGGTESDSLTPEELYVLRFISSDQMTPFAMTAEVKIVADLSIRNIPPDNLRFLHKKGFLEARSSTTDGAIYYHITEKAEQYLLKLR